jgi:hypothetical protein
MNYKITVTLLSGVALLATTGCSSMSSKPTKTVEQVMEEGFEGQESLNARVTKGQGTPAEIAHLAELVAQLALNKPPQGDLASWTEKTVALNKAAADLVAGKPGAMDAYKAAANCKACHSVHKPEKH